MSEQSTRIWVQEAAVIDGWKIYKLSSGGASTTSPDEKFGIVVRDGELEVSPEPGRETAPVCYRIPVAALKALLEAAEP